MKDLNVVAKLINANLMGEKFVDKPVNEYLYASLTQPPIKIIDRCGSDDELDYIVECPNCGSHINYGECTYMLSGHIFCNTGDCREKLINGNEYLKRKYGGEK